MKKVLTCECTEDICTMADQTGVLPACAPLANPYVPFQRTGAAKYDQNKALARGTLFPGLDLPFMGMTNPAFQNPTLKTQLQALDFVLAELGLYLDTHPDDSEAAEMYEKYAQIAKEARAAYEAQCGPLLQRDSAEDGGYHWLHDPWPWENPDQKGCKEEN